MSRRRPRARPVEVARGLWGLSLLVGPRVLLQVVGGGPPDARAVSVARVLGVRHLVQAAVSGGSPTRPVLACGAWVDGVHALTSLALAGVDRSRARLGLLDAAVAAGWAVASLRDLAAAPPDQADPRWTTRVALRVLPHLPGAPRPR